MKSTNVKVLGYNVYGRELSMLQLNNRMVINTLNGHSYNVAKKDEEFKNSLLESDILLPDGVSIVIGAKLLHGIHIQKIAGYDIFVYLLNALNKQKGSCFFLGSSDETLLRITSRLQKDFPNVKVGYFSPPYRAQFSEGDNDVMQKHVNSFRPDVLFVGMTAPKQEKWVNSNKDNLDAGIICSIGAVFDFYAGTLKRPPKWMINLKLEWLGRLLKEPKRMWKRYLLSTPVFFVDVFRYKLGLLKLERDSK